VEELEDRPELQHVYLHKLFKRDHHKGQRYHEKQISLYAEYDRSNLLPFLRDSTHCPLEKALEICQQRNFVEETVYLLSRMGNSRSALKMIMEELHDVDKAIEFAKEQDDGELWEDLILYSIDKPPFITGLLNNIGTHVDPILLIHRIKEGMEIPNLRDSLVKILQDYNLQILLREGCKKILVADSLSLLKKMHRTQMKGVLVDEENICESCLSPILPSDAAKPFSVLVFHCRHMFHKECLPGPSTVSWPPGSPTPQSSLQSGGRAQKCPHRPVASQDSLSQEGVLQEPDKPQPQTLCHRMGGSQLSSNLFLGLISRT